MSVTRTAGKSGPAFTLVEVIVVILIVSILAGVAIPMLSAKVNTAKWSEANSAAGTIRTAVTAYIAGNDIESARALLIGKNLGDAGAQAILGFDEHDLTGTYFVPGDYVITSIDQFGKVTITVTSSRDNAPEGEKTLLSDGTWQ